MYLKSSRPLSQEEEADNLIAVLGCPNFQRCVVDNASYLITTNFDMKSLGKNNYPGNEVTTLGDIGNVLMDVLGYIPKGNQLERVMINLKLPQEEVMNFGFDQEVYDADAVPPMQIMFRGDQATKVEGNLSFVVSDRGLDEDAYVDNGIDVSSVKQVRGKWYAEVTRTLNERLPHPVMDGYNF